MAWKRTPENAQGNALRAARIMELRAQRVPMEECAREFGISLSHAYRIYRQALAEHPSQMVEEYRREELDLTDAAVRDLLSVARGEPETRTKLVKGELIEFEAWPSFRDRIEAWAVIGRWSEHKMKITGGYAPTQIQFTPESVQAEIERLTALLEAELARDVLELEA